MTRTRLRVCLVALLLIAVSGTSLWQGRKAQLLKGQVSGLRQQIGQMRALEEENERLCKELKLAAASAETTSGEVARLRGQMGRLREMEHENALLKLKEPLTKPNVMPGADEGPFDRFLGPGSNARARHAKVWGYALLTYAQEHQDRFPASLQEAMAFLGPDFLTLEDKAQAAHTIDQFEMLFQGRLEDMTNPPPEGAVVLREKRPWRTAQGEWARVYVYGNGGATIHTEPDGDFEKWEGPRIPKSNNP